LNLHLIPIETQTQIEQLARLAKSIWEQHFTPIIGDEQVDYMLTHFQSAEAIRQQIRDGALYFVAHTEQGQQSYMAVIPSVEKGKAMLSKLYVEHSARGTGIGKALLTHAEKVTRDLRLNALWLTVNRFNDDTIAWYKRQGFSVVDEQKKDIGNGFFMDDLIMEKTV